MLGANAFGWGEFGQGYPANGSTPAVVAAILSYGVQKVYGASFTVTPSDTLRLPMVATGLYVGVAGDVSVGFNDDSSATFVAVPANTVLPIQTKRVMATGTTATSIMGLQ